MFHIFRNTPLGRENLLQSAYFCEQVGDLTLTVYIPDHTQCAMYSNGAVVTISLDASYTRHGETAVQHVEEILCDRRFDHNYFVPTSFTANDFPDIPSDWAVMACPRTIASHVSRIGLDHIGPKVRSIVKHSPFPVFIPSASFIPWKRICAFCGSTELGMNVIWQSHRLSAQTGAPLIMCTQGDDTSRADYEEKARLDSLSPDSTQVQVDWVTFDPGSLEENLYAVPGDSLVVVGAAGETLMRGLVFGSDLETIQKTLPNPLLVVGPKAKLV